MPYYGVQMHYRLEVLVKADSEAEAEEKANHGNFDASMIDVESAEADHEYDPNEEGDAECIATFKAQRRYVE